MTQSKIYHVLLSTWLLLWMVFFAASSSLVLVDAVEVYCYADSLESRLPPNNWTASETAILNGSNSILTQTEINDEPNFGYLRTTNEFRTFYVGSPGVGSTPQGPLMTYVCFYSVVCPRDFIVVLETRRGRRGTLEVLNHSGTISVYDASGEGVGGLSPAYEFDSTRKKYASMVQQITSLQAATLKLVAETTLSGGMWLGVTATCAPASYETLCPFQDQSLEGSSPQSFRSPSRDLPGGVSCSWRVSCPIGYEILLESYTYSSSSTPPQLSVSRFGRDDDSDVLHWGHHSSIKMLLGATTATIHLKTSQWENIEPYLSIDTDCKLGSVTTLFIAVGSMFGFFVGTVFIACCLCSSQSRARGDERNSWSCVGRWVWDIVLALLHLFEASSCLLVIAIVYTSEELSLNPSVSSYPLLVTAITTFSLWLVVCPVIALVPCLRATCGTCCSESGGGHHHHRRSNNNNNSKGGGGAILIILFLVSTAPLWIWMGYNFAVACVDTIFGEEAMKKWRRLEAEENNDRWAFFLESWLRSKKSHAPYFISCLGTIYMLVIELAGLAVISNSLGSLVVPIQHLSICFKLLSLVCKGYCLCAGSLQFKIAVFKYALVLLDLFSFVYSIAAVSQSFIDKPLSDLVNVFASSGNSSLTSWWIRVSIFKIAYAGLVGGSCLMVWWKKREEAEQEDSIPITLPVQLSGWCPAACWLWATFVTLPIALIVAPLLELAKFSWILMPLHLVEPEIKDSLVHLQTLNILEEGRAKAVVPQKSRLEELQKLHETKTRVHQGSSLLQSFFYCCAILLPYFVGQVFSVLFPILHLTSTVGGPVVDGVYGGYLICSMLFLVLALVVGIVLAPSGWRYFQYCRLFSCETALSRSELSTIKDRLADSYKTQPAEIVNTSDGLEMEPRGEAPIQQPTQYPYIYPTARFTVEYYGEDDYAHPRVIRSS